MSGIILHPDLSQIEYRLIAHETREPKLIKAIRAGEDIHANFAKFVTGAPPKDKADRKIWKTANFARIYGTGLRKFMYLTGLTYEQARAIFKKTDGIYPYIDDYKAELMDVLMTGERVKLLNLFGRVRYMSLYEFTGANTSERARNAHREAFNWIFQSSGHDVLMVWLLETMDFLDPAVLLINDVHDEYVLDCPSALVEKTLAAVKDTSSRLNDIVYKAFGVKLRVPLEAEIEQGETWK